jgi:hypothetical protein
MRFPAGLRDQGQFYLDRGYYLCPAPLHRKGMFAGTHGHLDASNDPSRLRDWISGYHGHLCWAAATEPSGLAVVDVEQHQISGKDGTHYLRLYAAALGLTSSLVPLGETPIALSPNVGFHVHFRCTAALRSGVVLPYVELKSRGSSIRLPDAPGRRWDVSSPAHLPLLLVPEWLSALVQTGTTSRTRLLPEGARGARPFTPIGHQVTGRIVNKALGKAQDMAAAQAAARGMGWLVAEDRVSSAYGRRVVERLAEALPDFAESGFTRGRLLKGMLEAFERRSRAHG